MRKGWLFIVSLTLIAVTTGCAMRQGSSLRREFLGQEQLIPGSYRVILYGARHGQDLETVAVLDREEDGIIFEPYAREYDYRVTDHLNEKDSLEEALRFISWYPSFLSGRVSALRDAQGRVLGYEVRPIYMRISTYGYSDVLNVHYELLEEKVLFYVRLRSEVERAIQGNGDRRYD